MSMLDRFARLIRIGEGVIVHVTCACNLRADGVGRRGRDDGRGAVERL
jgi:hypothetical protein